jgi:hypothetical protein
VFDNFIMGHAWIIAYSLSRWAIPFVIWSGTHNPSPNPFPPREGGFDSDRQFGYCNNAFDWFFISWIFWSITGSIPELLPAMERVT